MKSKEYYMQEAVKEAVRGVKVGHGGPFGAVIVRRGKIIAKEHNKVIKLNDPTAHAEVLAIRRACEKLKKFSLKDCEIYSSCEPCPMCFSAIHWARIPVLYYACTREDAERIGFDDNLLYRMISGKEKKPSFKIKKIGRKIALEAFKLWETKVDKKQY